jgi:hypothetical protein
MPPGARLPAQADRLAEADASHGGGMDSAEPAYLLAAALRDAATSPGPSGQVDTVPMRGRELLTRVANQSNLIPDPDLDSGQTMSLLALRYPELLEQVHGLGQLLQRGAQARDAGEQRTQHLIFEGRLAAMAQGIQSDHAKAYAAGSAALQQALRPQQGALASALGMDHQAARDVAEQCATAATVAQMQTVQRGAVLALQRRWLASTTAMDRVLQARIAAAARAGWRGRHRAPHRRPHPARRVEQQRRNRPAGGGLHRHAGPAGP